MLLSGLSVCYTAAEIARKEGNEIILPQTISYHSWRQPLSSWVCKLFYQSKSLVLQLHINEL